MRAGNFVEASTDLVNFSGLIAPDRTSLNQTRTRMGVADRTCYVLPR
jgi:hypothetical protein